MAATAKLSTVATLNSSGFTSGIAKMRTSMSAFSAFSAGAFASIGHRFVGFLNTSIRTIPHFVTQGLELGDALDDASKRLGIAGGALASFRRVAAFAGVEAEAFDTALGKMSVGIADAADKGGDLQKMFRAVGLDAKKLMALGPEKAFLAISDAVAGMVDPFRRAQLARAAFGRGGERLIPALLRGSSGFASARREAGTLGISPTRTNLAGIGIAKDSLDDLGNALKGFKLTLASKMIAPIEAMAKALTGATTRFGVIEVVADEVATTLIQLGASFELMGRFIDNTIAGFKGYFGGHGQITPMDAPTTFEKHVMASINRLGDQAAAEVIGSNAAAESPAMLTPNERRRAERTARRTARQAANERRRAERTARQAANERRRKSLMLKDRDPNVGPIYKNFEPFVGPPSSADRGIWTQSGAMSEDEQTRYLKVISQQIETTNRLLEKNKGGMGN